MHRKNLAIIFGFLSAITPFFGLTSTIETGLIVLFGLSVPFVLLFPRALSPDEKIESIDSQKTE